MRIITLLTALVFSLFTIEAKCYDGSDILKKGDKVPDFNFVSSEGQTKSFSEYKGKVALVVFFATWCQPCREELPHIQKEIWEIYKNNDNFRLLVIGRGHSIEEINAFSNSNNFSFPIVADKEKAIYSSFAVQYIPRCYLINSDGIVIGTSKGYERKQFNRLVKQISRELSKVQ